MLNPDFLKYLLTVIFFGILTVPTHGNGIFRLLPLSRKRSDRLGSILRFMQEMYENSGHFMVEVTNCPEPSACSVCSIHDALLDSWYAFSGKRSQFEGVILSRFTNNLKPKTQIIWQSK